MPFPESERVIYGKNPLVEVICQLRFPPILRIETEVPAAFQDLLRREYPLLQEVSALTPPEGLPPDVAAFVSSLAQATKRVSREFVDSDGTWKVSLTRDFVALTTTQYERWEEFRDRLSRVLSALTEVYEPAFFTRVGLRYKDAIGRSRLGLEGQEWAQLLRLELAAELAADDVKGDVAEAQHQVVFRLSNGSGRVRLAHGLAVENETGEVGYLIDADFSTTDRTEVSDASSVLDSFNRQAGWLFRWCIRDELHAAMDPRKP